MALDSIFLRAITLELNTRLTGARVEKAMQPERDSIILALHTNTGSAKLIASASPSSARIQLTDMQLKNPDHPPGRNRPVDPPEKIMRQFQRRRLLERSHLAALRIHAGHHVPDRSVLTARVHGLKHQ